MNYPCAITERPSIHPRLGIKSSLPKAKSALAAALLIKEVSEDCDGIKYSVASQTSKQPQIEFENTLLEKIYRWIKGLLPNIPLTCEELRILLNQSPLIAKQMEPLQVLFENYWRFAKIDHVVSEEVSSTCEREGGLRYPKKITFTTYADLISLMFKDASQQEEYARVLISWLKNEKHTVNDNIEQKLIKSLTILSELALFKLKRNDGVDIIFDLYEVYRKISTTNEPVYVKPSDEMKGALRILNSTVTEGLNYFLEKKDNCLNLRTGLRAEFLQHLSNLQMSLMMNPSLNDVIVNSSEQETVSESNLNYVTDYISTFEWNRILFGAPGTGKSFKLNQDAVSLLSTRDATRVTFHPEYTYFNFVGSYKPIMKAGKGDNSEEEISYDFVPGPFTTVLVEALKSAQKGKSEPHLLIIEEINRSRVASVFGEVFQLLDRNEDGVSEYAIKPSPELKDYLEKQLKCSISSIRIPNNMFIWATMNSADQGVFPMDTAFKRRWDFEYIGVDHNEELASAEITIGEIVMDWNMLRKKINQKLESLGVNEDKLIGPFFIAKKYLSPLQKGSMITGEEKKIAEAKFLEVFKSKVISYLFDDAAKHMRSKLFEGCGTRRYSHICQQFDEIGIAIFGASFTNDMEY